MAAQIVSRIEVMLALRFGCRRQELNQTGAKLFNRGKSQARLAFPVAAGLANF